MGAKIRRVSVRTICNRTRSRATLLRRPASSYQRRVTGRITGHLAEDDEPLSKRRYTYDYDVIDVDRRQWNDKAYFVPIPLQEMQRNPELVQNLGY